MTETMDKAATAGKWNSGEIMAKKLQNRRRQSIDGGVRLEVTSQYRHTFESFTFHLPVLCDQCQHALTIGGVKCTECGFRCHKKCAKLASPRCGMGNFSHVAHELLCSPTVVWDSHDNTVVLAKTSSVPAFRTQRSMSVSGSLGGPSLEDMPPVLASRRQSLDTFTDLERPSSRCLELRRGSISSLYSGEPPPCPSPAKPIYHHSFSWNAPELEHVSSYTNGVAMTGSFVDMKGRQPSLSSNPSLAFASTASGGAPGDSAASQLESEIQLESDFAPPIFKQELVIGYQRLKGADADIRSERRWPSPTRSDSLDRAKAASMMRLVSHKPDERAATISVQQQNHQIPGHEWDRSTVSTPTAASTRAILSSFMRSLSGPKRKRRKEAALEQESAASVESPSSSESVIKSPKTSKTPRLERQRSRDTFHMPPTIDAPDPVTPFINKRNKATTSAMLNPIDASFPKSRFLAELTEQSEGINRREEFDQSGAELSAAKAWRSSKRRRSSPLLHGATDLQVVHELEFQHADSLPEFGKSRPSPSPSPIAPTPSFTSLRHNARRNSADDAFSHTPQQAPRARRASCGNMLQILPPDSDIEAISKTQPKLSRSLSCMIISNPAADSTELVPPVGHCHAAEPSENGNANEINNGTVHPTFSLPMALASYTSQTIDITTHDILSEASSAESVAQYPIRLEVVRGRGLVRRLTCGDLSDELLDFQRRYSLSIDTHGESPGSQPELSRLEAANNGLDDDIADDALAEFEINLSDVCTAEAVGQGSFGTVYRGRWHGDVAVKMLNSSCWPTDEQIEDFRREVAMLSLCRHENIVLFMGACTTPPKLAIVMEWCAGATLYNELHTKDNDETEGLSLVECMDIALQTARGMGYLHARDIIHRDLKSPNVFLVDSRSTRKPGQKPKLRVRVGDFGLAALAERTFSNKDGDEPKATAPVGSVIWMAPESIRNGKDCTFKSDVYSFGIVLYELLTSQMPHKGLLLEQVMFMVACGLVKPDMSAIPADCPVSLRELLLGCISLQPTSRPSFQAIAQQLEEHIHGASSCLAPK